MSALRRAMMAANAKLDYLLDSDGRKICANLPNGTRLRWSNLIDYTKPLRGANATVSYDGEKVIADCSTGTGTYVGPVYAVQLSITNKYYASAKFKQIDSDGTTLKLQIGNASEGLGENIGKPTEWTECNFVGTAKTSNRVNFQSISINARSGIFYSKEQTWFNLTDMFSQCSQYLPDTLAAFQSTFWSQGTEASKELGYTPYTPTPIECVVKNGYVVKLNE